MGIQAGFKIVSIVIVLAILGLGIYLFMLSIKFLRLGIKAFKIYIDNNKYNDK